MTDVKLSSKESIMLQCYATSCFIAELKNNNFEETYLKTMSFEDKTVEYIMKKSGLGNPGYYLLALYGILVLPKEADKSYTQHIKKIDKQIDQMNLTIDDGYNKKGQHCRHIKNSISHGHSEFLDPDMVFFDEDKETGEKYRLEIPREKMGELLRVMVLELQVYFNTLLSKKVKI